MTLLTVISMTTKITEITWNVKSHEMSNHNFRWQFLVIIFDDNFLWPFLMTNFDNNFLWWYMIHDTCYMMIKYTVGTNILLNIINIYADVDAISMTPSRNTRSYTLRSVPSSPGRSIFYVLCSMFYVLCSMLIAVIAIFLLIATKGWILTMIIQWDDPMSHVKNPYKYKRLTCH